MKFILAAVLVSIGLSFIIVSPASASSSLVGPTALNEGSWKTIFTGSGGSNPSFEWVYPAPGKKTTIRTVTCDSNPFEYGRGQFAANDTSRRAIGSTMFMGCFKVQGRMPDGEGNMANAHYGNVYY